MRVSQYEQASISQVGTRAWRRGLSFCSKRGRRNGLGQRIGTRYGQSFVKGLAVFGVGLIVKDDPRLVAYASDSLTVFPLDSLTVEP
jgi:hypothetical protein